MTVIGVLALQGDFAEHCTMVRQLGAECREVRLPADLEAAAGLIIPGGESTVIGKLMVAYGLLEPIQQRAKSGFPIWGTCAGMIMLASRLDGHVQPLIGAMDITAKRNAFGRQLDSFETDLTVEGLDTPFHAVFIRAPLIESVGPAAHAIARLPDGRIVGAAQGNLLATAFHPEITHDPRLHQRFLDIVERHGGDRN